MSWISKNYEKAALGGAVVIALGLAYLGYSKINSVETDFATALKQGGNNDPAVTDAGKVTKAKSSVEMPRKFERGMVGERPVNLFTGIPLFIPRAGGKPVDPEGDPTPIHPPIPNKWWLQYHLDPGFADSPQRDADSDGFSNLDEFQGNTDPTDPKKFPGLVNKVKFVKEEALIWVLRPGFEVEGGYTFAYDDTEHRTNRVNPAAIIMPGGLFFKDGVMANRFKLLKSEERKVMNERTKEEMPVRFVMVEDQKPNKDKKVYELAAQFPDRDRAKFANYDRTAVLRLDALGLGANEFKVEENTDFALPPDGPSKDYHLKSITPESIEIEYKDADGSQKSIVIPKG